MYLYLFFQRLNVSLTRAKALLIVIGNPDVLKFDENWRYFINYCKENESCTGSPVNAEKLSAEEITELLKRTKIKATGKKNEPRVEIPLILYEEKVKSPSPTKRSIRSPKGNGKLFLIMLFVFINYFLTLTMSTFALKLDMKKDQFYKKSILQHFRRSGFKNI